MNRVACIIAAVTCVSMPLQHDASWCLLDTFIVCPIVKEQFQSHEDNQETLSSLTPPVTHSGLVYGSSEVSTQDSGLSTSIIGTPFLCGDANHRSLNSHYTCNSVKFDF